MVMIAATEVSVDELREMLERHEPVTVLDVREAEARAEWSIPGSLHIDAFQALKAGDPQALAGFDAPIETPVVAVCVAGNTSQIAVRLLRERGFDAHSMSGGMNAWSAAWNQAEVRLDRSPATIVQVRRTGKGCLSYLIGSDSEAMVLDASVEPEIYLALAAERGWTITHLVDTHIHADHLSRSRRLAEQTGASLHLPENNRAGYPFSPLRDGDAMAFGGSRLVALSTPGHTGESMSYLLDDLALFTGDTLFLGAVGRPDLEADVAEARVRAEALWSSLRRLEKLPAETLVLPGHTSQPIAFDNEPIAATLGEVTGAIPLLRLDQAAFVERVLANLPENPPNHASIVAFNEDGSFPDGDLNELEAGANRCAISAT